MRTFLTSTPELLARHLEDVKGILEYIDEEELMPPNGVPSVGLVKEWLIERVKEIISDSFHFLYEDQELTKSHRLETAARLK
ncbi:hypothetical protein BDZ97DRAFT_1821304 [Flammula alnicola]|nr:hypothetical protein BDZ97DRAFT_1821304 [Flammula alnicola]